MNRLQSASLKGTNMYHLQTQIAQALSKGNAMYLMLLPTLALLIYCLGHTLILSEPWQIAASFAWSLSHGLAVSTLLFSLRYMPTGLSWRRVTVMFMLPVLSSSLSYLLIAALFWQPLQWVHDYVSLSLYLLMSLFSIGLTQVTPGKCWLTLDFGSHKKMIPLNKVVAVHGARNYLELEVSGLQNQGVLRDTLENFSHQYAGTFLRVHRSHLVNPKTIVDVIKGPRGNLLLVLQNTSRVPVSPGYRDALWQALNLVPGQEDWSQTAFLQVAARQNQGA
ncbi:LytTR family DNA-binding domain-containing protein [Aliiglaciecola sp. CAU 1673]|uniref:LytTR family DNA-binding domain-containing protein n=1 Tax=Aliiglaciecola sp. CAU 1673 TaxID=3032595 RepID=UPI0023DADE4F|nr:LytTR family DNA-binding domain-containing protein [Aliiglaciecola sp. CAU 1673]MDF2180261.1 LytTR family DNA-binding domain-containing protein [Aliiglaciecola sp. CAU 1673]